MRRRSKEKRRGRSWTTSAASHGTTWWKRMS
jgi:hypothetical protein